MENENAVTSSICSLPRFESVSEEHRNTAHDAKNAGKETSSLPVFIVDTSAPRPGCE